LRNPPVSSFEEMIVKVYNETNMRENEFEFTRVFEKETKQSEVYHEVSGLVTSALDGYNVCIIAYGQTGSGKTYTMEGTKANRGITRRTFQEFFEIISERQGTCTYELSVSIVEIYNEKINDLLSGDKQNVKLQTNA
jgi:kinesin family member C2/C3